MKGSQTKNIYFNVIFYERKFNLFQSKDRFNVNRKPCRTFIYLHDLDHCNDLLEHCQIIQH